MQRFREMIGRDEEDADRLPVDSNARSDISVLVLDPDRARAVAQMIHDLSRRAVEGPGRRCAALPALASNQKSSATGAFTGYTTGSLAI